MTTTNEDLLAKFQEVCTELADLRVAYAEEARKRDVRILTNRVLTGVAIVAAAVASWVGVAGIQEQDRTNRATDVARITSCVKQNADTLTDAQHVKDDFVTFIDLVFPGPRSPTVEARIASGIVTYDRAIDSHRKLRDCSPAGVKAYLSGTVPTSVVPPTAGP